MKEFKCPHCGSDKLDVIVCDGEEETLLCTECGCDEFDFDSEELEGVKKKKKDEKPAEK